MTATLERQAVIGLVETEATHTFFDAIGRPDLKEKITDKTPIYYPVMGANIPGGSIAGGLEILAGDAYALAGKLGIPLLVATIAYEKRWRQTVTYSDEKSTFTYGEEHYKEPVEKHWTLDPCSPVNIFTQPNGKIVPTELNIYSQQNGAAKALGIHEPNIGGLYGGGVDSDHRIYQEAALSFGIAAAMQKMGIFPSAVFANESATAFSLLSYLDKQYQGQGVDAALDMVRNNGAVYVNHTLNPGAEARIPLGMFPKYVVPNLKNKDLVDWLLELANKTGNLRLSTLALTLTGEDKRIGVSKLHAEVAGKRFKDSQGNDVVFGSETNGISLEKWIYPSLLRFYEAHGIVDRFELPQKGYEEKINRVNKELLRSIKGVARRELRDYLKTRKDQYGDSVDIDESAKIATWAKRFVNYKRPEMLLEDPDKLAQILEARNMHIVFSSKIVEDKKKFEAFLGKIDKHDILKKRVHYIPDYDTDLAKHLVAGSDIWLNTPVVGEEACGTSWMKAVGNLTILISTEDGGVADVSPPSCLKIDNGYYQQEVDSLYDNLRVAAAIVDAKDTWDFFVKNQLESYLPTISGGRWIRDYINRVFPKVTGVS